MNLKKFAIRGIIFLAVFVALCMFFSGTVRTITTPKVRLFTPKKGKLEERIKLSCKPAFPNAEPVSFGLSDGITLSIVKVNSRAGYTVTAGEVIVEAKVADFDSKYKQYQSDYDAAAAQLLSIESKNRKTRITQRDQAYADAYYGMQSARHDMVDKEIEMDTLLSREKLERTKTGYPEGASDALKKAIDAWRSASEVLDKAQAEMDDVSRYNIDETVWAYITERKEQQEKLEEAEKGLRTLVALNDNAKAIVAPHDGYLAEMKVNVGDSYDGTQEMFTITPEDALPTLRADLSNVSRTVTEGMNVSMENNTGISSKVVGIGTDAENKKYADIEMTREIINAVGSVYSIMENGTNMVLVYNARESTTLLDTNVVRGSNPEYFVYVAKRNEGAFAGDTYKVEEKKVKVLAMTAEKVSVQDDLSAYVLAYGEDRTIGNGDTVMEYVQASGDDEDTE
ncbi:MAG: hypothetical protein IJI71_11035 [Clostridia bacterium]|nr:hypothetical protein [Clostridia bacterium]